MIARAWVRVELYIHSSWAVLTSGYLEPMVEALDPLGIGVPIDGISLGIDSNGASIYFKNYAQTTDQGDFIAAFGGGAATALLDRILPIEIEVTLNDDFTITSSYRIDDDALLADESTYTNGQPQGFDQTPTAPTGIDGFGLPIIRGTDGLLDARLAQYGVVDWLGAGGTVKFSCDYSGLSPFVPPFDGQYVDNIGDFKLRLGSLLFPPVITSFFPESGTDGTQVTIIGRNFIGVTQVEFNTGATALFDHEGPDLYTAAYAHNSPFAVGGPYQAVLTAPEETDFRAWVIYQQIPFDVNASTVDYDMRGYWKAQPGHSATLPTHTDGDHFPDTFKTPYDTTFSKESEYATGDCPFEWQGDALIDTRDTSLIFGVLPKNAESFVVVSGTKITCVAPVFVASGKLHVTGPGGTSP